MIPTDFEQSNVSLGPPGDMQQVQTIRAFYGEMKTGPVDGAKIFVTAWEPSPQDLQRILAGEPVFLTTIGVIPPHRITTSFDEATGP